jgi:hypothetical protein
MNLGIKKMKVDKIYTEVVFNVKYLTKRKNSGTYIEELIDKVEAIESYCTGGDIGKKGEYVISTSNKNCREIDLIKIFMEFVSENIKEIKSFNFIIYHY